MTTLILPSAINAVSIQEIFSIPISGFQDKVKEKLERDIAFEELRKDIGDNLFNALSEEEKLFILETEGSVDFGYEINLKNLKRIFASIKNEYGY